MNMTEQGTLVSGGSGNFKSLTEIIDTPALNSSSLRHEDHKIMDERMVRVATGQLNGVSDLIGRGLVYRVDNYGKTLSQYEKISRVAGATVSMEPEVGADQDRIVFDMEEIPIPVISKRFTYGMRQQKASTSNGHTALPLEHLVASTEMVSDKLEDMLFNGLGNFTFAGKRVEGYTSHPSRIIQQLSGAWSDVGQRDIMRDVRNMIQAMFSIHRNGQYMIYVASNVWVQLYQDYNEQKGTNTFLQQIRSYDGILDVKPSRFLDDDDIVMVHMDYNTIDWCIAYDMQTVQWAHDYHTDRYAVLTMAVPRVKSDIEDNVGVVHASA